MIDVCLLGSGGMLPLPERKLTSMLIRNNGRMILVDCGEGTQVGIRIAGWGFKNIDAICFTHYHADHVTGLPGFLLTLGNNGRTDPLTIIGPPFLKEVIHSLCVICPELPYEIELIELTPNDSASINIGSFHISTLFVDHWINCLAYRFDLERQGKFDVDRAKSLNIPMQFWKQLQKGETVSHNEKIYEPAMVMGKKRSGIRITYSTDTRPTNDMVQFCQHSDLLVLEGMYGSDDLLSKAVDKKHMLYSEAATIAAQSHSTELWLTHFSPSMDDPYEFLTYATHIFPNTQIGSDNLKKTIYYNDEE